jgi:hypothetical protein
MGKPNRQAKSPSLVDYPVRAKATAGSGSRKSAKWADEFQWMAEVLRALVTHANGVPTSPYETLLAGIADDKQSLASHMREVELTPLNRTHDGLGHDVLPG